MKNPDFSIMIAWVLLVLSTRLDSSLSSSCSFGSCILTITEDDGLKNTINLQKYYFTTLVDFDTYGSHYILSPCGAINNYTQGAEFECFDAKSCKITSYGFIPLGDPKDQVCDSLVLLSFYVQKIGP